MNRYTLAIRNGSWQRPDSVVEAVPDESFINRRDALLYAAMLTDRRGSVYILDWFLRRVFILSLRESR